MLTMLTRLEENKGLALHDSFMLNVRLTRWNFVSKIAIGVKSES